MAARPPSPLAAGAVPDWILLLGGLGLTLSVAELLARWSPGAGYAFAAIVIIGYLSAGNRLDTVMAWLQSTGFVK